jgi:hypothetical protein
MDKNDGSVKEQAVQASPPSCEVRLEPVPGAPAVQVLLRVGRSSVRAEVQVDTDDAVPLQVTWNQERVLHLASGPRAVLTLPEDERYAPAAPLLPARDSGKLDLLFLMDGTTKTVANAGKAAILASLLEGNKSELREQLAQKFVLLTTDLRKSYSDVRTGVLAFGDHSMHFISSAPDLACRYLFYPENREERKLRPYNSKQLRQQIMQLPPTGGGDFVDALGEALHECGQVGWRPDARRILLLAGDSPGFSLLDPAPAGADVHVRCSDVDAEALQLHTQHRVEILTLYLGNPASSENNPYGISAPKAVEFLDHARTQYRKLASLPALSWEDLTFDPLAAAQAIQSVPQRIARGACWGILV